MASSTERPRALEDEIDFTVPYDPGLAPPSRHILVFFVAGNPGLIEYYRNYLADLATLLARRTRQDGVPAKDVRYHVHGASLAGFDLSPKSRRRLSSRPKHAPPFSLDEIKQDLIGRVQDKARSIADAYRVDKRQISVILIGHSVGAWLLLETVAWYQDARSRSSKEDSLEHLPLPDVRIVGGILLFPTVIELSRSPSGLVSAWFLQWQGTAFAISVFAKIMFSLVPISLLASFLQLLLRMPHQPARVTASFLQSSQGVRQALHMVRDEFRQVDADQWTDELWGVASQPQRHTNGTVRASSPERILNPNAEAKVISGEVMSATGPPPPKVSLFFFWGHNDHWVANTTRDYLIAKRSRTAAPGDQGRPVMELDSDQLSHAFSLKDEGARVVAEKTVGWIKEIERGLP